MAARSILQNPGKTAVVPVLPPRAPLPSTTVFPSNFSELPPALFVTDKIKSDEYFGKKETQEFKDLPLAARIKHVLYQVGD